MLLSIIIGISSNLLNLVIAGALFILGYQVIMLGYFAKTYAVTHLGERSRFVEKLISLVSLEKGIGISIFFIILGLILAFISKYAFNVQFPKVTLVTLAVVLFVISLQTFFNVFFLSIIGIEQK